MPSDDDTVQTNANHELELGKLRDQLADVQSENEELKVALLESHHSLAAAQSSLDSAKQIASRAETKQHQSESQVNGLNADITLLNEDLRLKIENISTLENDAASSNARKEELHAIKRVAKKLSQQLTLALDTSNRKQNNLQNQLHASQKICQTQRLELDEFTAQLRTEWSVEKAENEAKITRLKRRYARLRTLQFEDKQQLLRESQEVVRAMQSQFEEFRRLAEHLFSIEAKQLEHKLHTQVESYEEELRYVTLAKDADYDQLVRSKDAKIMSLIEGTDFNAILIKHAMELQQQRQRHVEAVAVLRREWKVIAKKDNEAMQSIVSDRDADIEALKHRIETAEERHRHLHESIDSQRVAMNKREERRNVIMMDKSNEISILTKKNRSLEQIKLNLRHQVLKLRLDATGGYNESLISLINRLKKEIDKLHIDHESLQRQYGIIALERTNLKTKLNKTMKSNIQLEMTLNDQRIELEQTTSTLKKSIRRRFQQKKSFSKMQQPRRLYEDEDEEYENDSPPPRRNRLPRQPQDHHEEGQYNEHGQSPSPVPPQKTEEEKEESQKKKRRERRKDITSAGLGRLSPSLGIEPSEMFPPTPSGSHIEDSSMSSSLASSFGNSTSDSVTGSVKDPETFDGGWAK